MAKKTEESLPMSLVRLKEALTMMRVPLDSPVVVILGKKRLKIYGVSEGRHSVRVWCKKDFIPKTVPFSRMVGELEIRARKTSKKGGGW